jgi:hypothetical protein
MRRLNLPNLIAPPADQGWSALPKKPTRKRVPQTRGLNLPTLRSSPRFTEFERSRAHPALLSGLKPPIHLKFGRLGVKILHRVTPKIGT